MLLSRKWLNEFVQVEADDKEFSEAMTLSGSKVENTEVLNASLKNVVAGRIIKLERHPDSDHMWVCQIDVGEAEPVQIVTGAWNIHEGDLVPVAKHNSLLPGGMKIEKGKLRGVVSNGMLCSLKELNLTVEHDAVGLVIGVLKRAAAFCFVDGRAHGGGDLVGIHDDQALRVSGSTADGLNQRGLGPEEALLVRVQNGHQRDLRQVQALPQEVDAHQHIKLAQP